MVRWTDDERELISKYYGGSLKFEVVLHRGDTCAEKRSTLLKMKGVYRKSLARAIFATLSSPIDGSNITSS